MINHRAHHSQGHILTVEDPIEYLFTHNRCTVDQREIGTDTHSFADALRNAMRQAPDVIMIGEIRDRETMEHAIAYAETGHLCVSTLHAANASQALKRIINFFPENMHPQLRLDLSLNLQAVLSQRLLPGRKGGRVLATELLLHSAYVADLVLKGAVDEIRHAIEKSTGVGMHTFDQVLLELYNAGRISEDTALANADCAPTCASACSCARPMIRAEQPWTKPPLSTPTLPRTRRRCRHGCRPCGRRFAACCRRPRSASATESRPSGRGAT